MSEYDEEQPPPSWRRPGASPNRWAAPATPAPTADDPVAPWTSPGFGRPFPGEPTSGEPSPEPASSYPNRRYGPPAGHDSPPAYPGSAGSSPTYPGSAGYSSPTSPRYEGPPSYDAPPSYEGPSSYGGPPPSYDAPPSYDGPSSYGGPPPSYGGPPSYEGPSSYGGAPSYEGPGEYSAPAPYSRPQAYPGTPEPATWQGGWQGSSEFGWPPPSGPPGYGSWGPPPAPGWAPLPPGPAPSRTSPLTVILIAVLIAAVIGLGIGGQLVTRHTTLRRVPSFFPAQTPGSVAPGNAGVSATQAAAIAANVNPTVVDINTKLAYQRAAAAGTGMVLTSDGQVLTNNHVIAGATSLTAAVVGGKSYTAKVLGTDPTDDIALIKLDGASGLTPIKTGDPSKLVPGDPIVAVGNAGGVGGTPSVVTGTVVALDQSVTASDVGGGNAEQLSGLIEINAPLQPGDSGGPLITVDSLIVGMNTAASASNRVESQSSVGFAIPITKAIAIAKEIAAGHASATIQIGVPGFLGVTVSPNPTVGVSGAVISGILATSPAEKAGLAAGDVITSISGQAVDSPSSLTAILRQRHPGDKVTVVWTDTTGKRHTATITLTVGPAA